MYPIALLQNTLNKKWTEQKEKMYKSAITVGVISIYFSIAGRKVKN